MGKNRKKPSRHKASAQTHVGTLNSQAKQKRNNKSASHAQQRSPRNQRTALVCQHSAQHGSRTLEKQSDSVRHAKQPASTKIISQKNSKQDTKTKKNSNPHARNPSPSKEKSRSASRASQGIMRTIGHALLMLLKKFGALLFSAFNHSCKTRIVGIMIIIALGAGVFDFVSNANKIYPGVTVGTVDVGGMTEQEAADILQTVYEPRVSINSVVFYANEEAQNNPETNDAIETIDEQLSYEESLKQRKQWTTPAEVVGASFDSAASARAAFEIGRNAGGLPARLSCLLFGATSNPVCAFDAKKLEALRVSMSSALGKLRVNYGVEIKDAKIRVTEGNDGKEVPEQWLISSLTEGYCQEEDTSSYVIELADAPLQITKDAAQHCAEIIQKCTSCGIAFSYEDISWKIDQANLLAFVTAQCIDKGNNSYELKPSFDENALKSNLLSRTSEQMQKNGLAVSFQVNDNKNVQVKSNTAGVVPEVNQVCDELNNTFFTDEERTEVPHYEISAHDVPKELTFDDACSYGIISEISSYTTEFSATAKARNNNIRLASDTISCSVASANGGTWSFNTIVGETTKERGYQSSGAIIGGEYSDDIGGGICQVATTVFNAVYNAGYPIVERHNHSLYIASYPEGRDAAIAHPYYDLVWQNNTSSDVLLVMSYTDSSLTAKLYGVNPHYEVSTEYGEWKKGEPYKTIYKDDDSLAEGTEKIQTVGANGRSISIVRVVKNAEGETLTRQTFESVYSPKNEVILRGTA